MDESLGEEQIMGASGVDVGNSKRIPDDFDRGIGPADPKAARHARHGPPAERHEPEPNDRPRKRGMEFMAYTLLNPYTTPHRHVKGIDRPLRRYSAVRRRPDTIC